MTSPLGPTERYNRSKLEQIRGDMLIDVVRDTVQQLEELTDRLSSFIENGEG